MHRRTQPRRVRGTRCKDAETKKNGAESYDRRYILLGTKGGVWIMNDATGAEKQNGNWEQVDGAKPKLLRMSVPGGWLVTVSGGASYPVSFYPDPEHAWNPPIRN